tara:strand:- start:1084 stop:1587 length:504 start_codon:yes stop_codon:yes gene_type:complete
MGKFASGKFAKGVSDRSGMVYNLREMRLEWNGSLVGPDEFERKHPQLGPFNLPVDGQAIKNARPARTENPIERLLNPDSFLSESASSAVITVTEPSHGKTTGDTVRFKKVNGFDGFTPSVLTQSIGYSITVVTTDTYTFSANGQTATSGGVRGGGVNATAGPVSVTP